MTGGCNTGLILIFELKYFIYILIAFEAGVQNTGATHIAPL
jgi:hypothetical protein